MIATLLGLLGGWKKWALLGAAAAAIAGWILVLNLTIAHRDTTIAKLQAANAKATADILLAQAVNQDALAKLAQRDRRHAAELAAITADRDRLAALAMAAPVIKETIHVEAQKCSGVPPAGRALADWVRQHPDPASDR